MLSISILLSASDIQVSLHADFRVAEPHSDPGTKEAGVERHGMLFEVRHVFGQTAWIIEIAGHRAHFQRGQIAQGAAAAIMMLVALAVVLVPYTLWLVWRRRREAADG